jgi:hypothetical protein
MLEGYAIRAYATNRAQNPWWKGGGWGTAPKLYRTAGLAKNAIVNGMGRSVAETAQVEIVAVSLQINVDKVPDLKNLTKDDHLVSWAEVALDGLKKTLGKEVPDLPQTFRVGDVVFGVV